MNRKTLTIVITATTAALCVLVAVVISKFIRAMNVRKSATNSNARAFLQMIRQCEGTAGPKGYQTTYGYSYFSNMADHPAITGEWKGKRLPDSMCINAGLKPGCVSTAAGAYQIIKPTWQSVKRALKLPDFSADSQDLAALYLIADNGALADVEAGNIEKAISKVRKVWASLPGAGYGQGEKTLSVALNYYRTAGGRLA